VHVPRVTKEQKMGNAALRHEFLVDPILQPSPHLVAQKNPVLVAHFVRGSLEMKDAQATTLFEASLATRLLDLIGAGLMDSAAR